MQILNTLGRVARFAAPTPAWRIMCPICCIFLVSLVSCFACCFDRGLSSSNELVELQNLQHSLSHWSLDPCWNTCILCLQMVKIGISHDT